MKAKVNQENCIGCAACTGVAPFVFKIGDNGLSYNMFGDDTILDPSLEEMVRMAAEGCPGQAIEIIE